MLTPNIYALETDLNFLFFLYFYYGITIDSTRAASHQLFYLPFVWSCPLRNNGLEEVKEISPLKTYYNCRGKP